VSVAHSGARDLVEVERLLSFKLYPCMALHLLLPPLVQFSTTIAALLAIATTYLNRGSLTK
jgi:hypothetical protein